MKIDVLIIGSGPAGAVAANQLASTGMTVAILERDSLPRHKACGGGISSSVSKVLDWDITPYVEARAVRQHCLLDYQRPVTIEMTKPLLMVDRPSFDHALVLRALELGGGNVTLEASCQVESVIEEDREVVVRLAGGRELRSTWLIAADGAYSVSRRCLGLDRIEHVMAALDAEIEVTDDVWEQHRESATFNYNCLPAGYGWVFPKVNVLSCGVGTVRTPQPLRRLLAKFLARTFPEGSIKSQRIFGHNIPYYHEHRCIATRRVIFVGDAAGVADPLMGEGILPGMKTGILAAELLRTAPDDCRGYQELVRESFGDTYWNLSRIGSSLLQSHPDLFYKRFVEQAGNSAVTLSNALARKHQETLGPAS